MSATIAELNEIAASIAAAVEEQSTATKEISNNVTEAADGTRDVAETISSVNQAADHSSKLALDVLNSANDLSEQSELLRKEVDDFLVTIRAA